MSAGDSLDELRRRTSRGGKHKRLAAYGQYCAALSESGRYVELLSAGSDARRLALELGQVEMAKYLGTLVAVALVALGKAEQSPERLYAARREYERIGSLLDARQCDADAAALLLHQGSTDEARRLLEPAYEYFVKVAASKDVALAQITLARIAEAEGDIEEAIRLLESSVALLDQGSDVPATAEAIETLGRVLFENDHGEQARRILRRAVTTWQSAGDPDHAVRCMVPLVEALKEHGDIEEARTWIGEIGAHATKQGDRKRVAEARAALGWLWLRADRHREAIDAFEDAQAGLDKATEAQAWLECEAGIGKALMDMEDFDAGLPRLDHAISGLRAHLKAVELAPLLQARGNGDARLGRFDAALDLLEEAQVPAQCFPTLLLKQDWHVGSVQPCCPRRSQPNCVDALEQVSRCRLVIAPAPTLGMVPFATLGLDTTASLGDLSRLP